MPYVLIEDFRGGVDDRKMPVSAVPGTLTGLVNGHITRGGEIEKRKAFHPYSLYSGPLLFGVMGGRGSIVSSARASRELWLFGEGASPWGGQTSAFLNYIDVTYPKAGSSPVRQILSKDWWGAEPLIVVEYVNDDTALFLGANWVDDTDPLKWDFSFDQALQDIAVIRGKVYGVQDTLIPFSGVNEPDVWGTGIGVGGGFIDTSTQGPGVFQMTAAAMYGEQLAAFSRDSCQIWNVDPDPDANGLFRQLDNFGCVSPRSIQKLGESDLLFCGYSGVRSLRARDSSSVPTVSDVGSAIDATLSAKIMSKLGLAERPLISPSIINPAEDRYWLAIDNTIYVLSYFPSERITAWSTYVLPFHVRDITRWGQTVYVLDTDNQIYAYGLNPVGSEYDDTVVEVTLPYIDAGRPADDKDWTQFDMAGTGWWEVLMGLDANNPDSEEKIGIYNSTTYERMSAAVTGRSPHARLRMQSRGDGYAKLSNVAMHYEGD